MEGLPVERVLDTSLYKYLFLAYRVKYGEVKIKYYQAYNMIGGYFTKTLQGDKFINFREKKWNIQFGEDGSTPIYGGYPQEFI